MSYPLIAADINRKAMQRVLLPPSPSAEALAQPPLNPTISDQDGLRAGVSSVFPNTKGKTFFSRRLTSPTPSCEVCFLLALSCHSPVYLSPDGSGLTPTLSIIPVHKCSL